MSQTKTLVRENNSFALDLYQQLRNEEGNLFFSPFSISTALAITYAGARNETAAEMAQVLHFSQEGEHLHKNFATILSDVQTECGEQVSIANRLWAQKGINFQEEFVNITKNQYQAPIAEVDFISESESARQKINNWVAQETQEKIQELIGKGLLNVDTRLVLTNAIYFKGDWALPFRENNTRETAFAISPDREVEVPMMYHFKVGLPYARLPELQVLELPYEKEKLSMVVLLPKAVDGLGALEQQLTPEKLDKWLSSLDFVQGGVQVWLPKFQMTSEFQMKETLSEMGMGLAFGDRADFSGINGKSDDLLLSEVVHKAFVDVNEKGTEAAAATGVMMATRSIPVAPKEIFRADRPFMFLIRENETGSILFLGRVVNPLGSSQ